MTNRATIKAKSIILLIQLMQWKYNSLNKA